MELLRSKWVVYCLFLMGGWTLTGCHYQFGRGELSQRYATISVPYIEGDQKGELTKEVIKKLSTSGAFRYVNHGGDLVLKIKLIELYDENIAFRYDRKKRGSLKKSIIPTETRLIALAEFQVIEAGTGKMISGPTRLTASIDFDHTYYSTRDEINVFSLGQLSDVDDARDAAMSPLNRHLAEQIIDNVINSW